MRSTRLIAAVIPAAFVLSPIAAFAAPTPVPAPVLSASPATTSNTMLDTPAEKLAFVQKLSPGIAALIPSSVIADDSISLQITPDGHLSTVNFAGDVVNLGIDVTSILPDTKDVVAPAPVTAYRASTVTFNTLPAPDDAATFTDGESTSDAKYYRSTTAKNNLYDALPVGVKDSIDPHSTTDSDVEFKAVSGQSFAVTRAGDNYVISVPTSENSHVSTRIDPEYPVPAPIQAPIAPEPANTFVSQLASALSNFFFPVR